MNQSNYVINAVLTAVTTISISEPGSQYKKGRETITPIPKAMVGGVLHACIPGSSIRGPLRRAAFNVMDQKIRKKLGDEPHFSLKEFYWNVIGGVRLSNEDAGNEFKNISEVAPFTLVENVRARNPLISLFGTFDPAPIAGHLQVANAICDEPWKLAGESNQVTTDTRCGVRVDDIARNASVVEVLTPESMDEWELMTSNARQSAALRRQIEELKMQISMSRKKGEDIASLSNQIKDIEKQREKLIKESDGSSVSVQQLIGDVEFISQGSKMNQRIRLVNTNDVEMGLLLSAFRLFADAPLLGGKRNIGAGEVSIVWDIKDISTRQVVAVVEASLDNGFVVHSGSEFVSQKIAAWDVFADSKLAAHYPTQDELKLAA